MLSAFIALKSLLESLSLLLFQFTSQLNVSLSHIGDYEVYLHDFEGYRGVGSNEFLVLREGAKGQGETEEEQDMDRPVVELE